MKKVLLTSFLFLICRNVYADINYKWPDYTPIEVTEKYKNEKAFYILYAQTYNFGDYRECSYVNFQRIYINKKEAIDKYANRELNLGTGGDIVLLAGRVIKKNGVIVELEKKNIIISKVEQGKKFSDELYRKASLIYPDVQEGDVLDLVYHIEFGNYIYSETMFLANDLPIMRSQISIRNGSILDLTAFRLNGLPEIETKKTAGGPLFYCEQTDVPAQPNGTFNAVSPTMPKLVYNLWNRGEKLDYRVVYKYNYLNTFRKYKTFGKLTTELIEKGILTEELVKTPFLGFITLHDYLTKNMKYDDDIVLGQTDLLKDYFNEKRVDKNIYLGILEHYCSENKIIFDNCYTGNLWKGSYDVGIVALDQMDERFFFVEDDAGQGHFVFPPTSAGNFYFIDEIPYQYEGNSAVGMRGREGILEEQAILQLPEGRENENQHTANIMLRIVSADLNKISGTRQDKFTGQYSSLVRKKEHGDIIKDLSFTNKHQEPKSIGIIYPYEVEFRQDITDTMLVQKIDESLSLLDISTFLPSSYFFEDEEDESLAGYVLLPFRKQHMFRFFIQSDAPIRTEEKENKMELTNSVGSCSFEVQQSGGSSLMLIVKINLNKRKLVNSEEHKEYLALLNFYDEMRKKKWAFNI